MAIDIYPHASVSHASHASSCLASSAKDACAAPQVSEVSPEVRGGAEVRGSRDRGCRGSSFASSAKDAFVGAEVRGSRDRGCRGSSFASSARGCRSSIYSLHASDGGNSPVPLRDFSQRPRCARVCVCACVRVCVCACRGLWCVGVGRREREGSHGERPFACRYGQELAVCTRALTYADVCCRMLTYADVC
jgi:hypothetical protein